jgi:hypothetical protein
MAKIKLNPLFGEVRGKLGRIVIKQSKNGQMFISQLPEKTNDRPSQAQVAQRESFAKASDYAAAIRADETARAFYEDLAQRRKTTVRALCMGDYLKAPTIHRLDVSDYNGRIGDPIYIRANDDVGVVAVNVLLTRADGTPIESGKAVEQRAGSGFWKYVATVHVPLGTDICISASAFDRPGNRAVVSATPIVGESDEPVYAN